MAGAVWPSHAAPDRPCGSMTTRINKSESSSGPVRAGPVQRRASKTKILAGGGNPQARRQPVGATESVPAPDAGWMSHAGATRTRPTRHVRLRRPLTQPARGGPCLAARDCAGWRAAAYRSRPRSCYQGRPLTSSLNRTVPPAPQTDGPCAGGNRARRFVFS